MKQAKPARVQAGPTRRFVVKTYVEARCASEALRMARRTRPDDVQSLDESQDGRRNGGSIDAMGFVVEASEEDDG